MSIKAGELEQLVSCPLVHTVFLESAATEDTRKHQRLEYWFISRVSSSVEKRM